MTNRLWQDVAAAAARAGEARVRVRRAGLARDLAAALPDVAVSDDGEAVRLQAPGLLARAFGSRRRAPDARLIGLATGDMR